MSDKTHVIEGPFLTRAKARRREHVFQGSLDYWARTGDTFERLALEKKGVPPWARGVRVERAGLFQWVLVATSTPGH